MDIYNLFSIKFSIDLREKCRLFSNSWFYCKIFHIVLVDNFMIDTIILSCLISSFSSLYRTCTCIWTDQGIEPYGAHLPLRIRGVLTKIFKWQYEKKWKFSQAFELRKEKVEKVKSIFFKICFDLSLNEGQTCNWEILILKCWEYYVNII